MINVVLYLLNLYDDIIIYGDEKNRLYGNMIMLNYVVIFFIFNNWVCKGYRV